MTQDWISVSDERPPYEKEVIVCRPNKFSGNIDVLIARLYKKNPDGQHYGRMGEGGYTYDDYWALPSICPLHKITYWMPLPEPKK